MVHRLRRHGTEDQDRRSRWPQWSGMVQHRFRQEQLRLLWQISLGSEHDHSASKLTRCLDLAVTDLGDGGSARCWSAAAACRSVAATWRCAGARTSTWQCAGARASTWWRAAAAATARRRATAATWAGAGRRSVGLGDWHATSGFAAARLGDGDRNRGLVADSALLGCDSEAWRDVAARRRSPSRCSFCAALGDGIRRRRQTSRTERHVCGGVDGRVRNDRGRSGC